MTKDDLNSIISYLEWLGYGITKNDIAWLMRFDTPEEAQREFLSEAAHGDECRVAALLAGERNS